MLNRSTPLKRTSILIRTGIKKRARKRKKWHDAKMLEACRGQNCWIMVPGVCPEITSDPTVVPAHSNFHEHGKAMGRKADDRYTVPACMACHSWLDSGPDEIELKRAVFMPALARWTAYRDREAA